MEFEINIENEVLVNIPFGKSYLSNIGVFKDQTGQKGNQTCWYYCMNFLRQRFGKDFSSDHPGRMFEKIISDYRKNIYQLEKCFTLAKFLKVNGVKVVDKKSLENFISNEKQIRESNKKIESDKLSALFDMAKYLLNKQEFESLDTYLKVRENEIEEEIIKSLGINSDSKIKEYLKESSSTRKYSDLDKDDIDGILNSIIMIEIAKRYGLEESTWDPLKEFSGLVQEIKTYGALYVGGFLGKFSYKKNTPAHQLNEKFGKREVYGWNENEFEFKDYGHAVLIIGTKKINGDEFVYFLDPFDPSKIDKPNPIYKIAYSKFKERIINMHGVPSYCHSDEAKFGPFGFRASNKLTQENNVEYRECFRHA